MANESELGIDLFFGIAFPAPVLSQEKSTWKEYRFTADGFALTVPTLPTPHDSPAFPGATVYEVPLKADSGVVLRVKKLGHDCSGVISLLKSPSARPVREISIEGHTGVEDRWNKSSVSTILE